MARGARSASAKAPRTCAQAFQGAVPDMAPPARSRGRWATSGARTELFRRAAANAEVLAAVFGGAE
eukprot:6975414-Pyramimonas_sp.AAC.1